MDRLLRWTSERLIRTGNLRVTTAGGCSFTVGNGAGTPVAIRFTSPAAQLGILTHPELRFGEAYMDGGIIVERGSIADVLAVLLAQSTERSPRGSARIPWLARFLYRRLMQLN